MEPQGNRLIDMVTENRLRAEIIKKAGSSYVSKKQIKEALDKEIEAMLSSIVFKGG